MPSTLEIYLCAAVAGSITDVCSRRIPNILTYGAMLCILIVSAHSGWAATGVALLSIVATIVIGSVLFGKGWIGGGDIKLIAAGAAAVGYPAFFLVIVYIAIAGGILAAGIATYQRRLRETVLNVALSAAAGTSVVPHATSSRIPYALAICAGSFYYAASESIAPWLRLAH